MFLISNDLLNSINIFFVKNWMGTIVHQKCRQDIFYNLEPFKAL